MSIATWYSHQYDAWRRNRRLAEIPLFTTTTDTRNRDNNNMAQEANQTDGAPNAKDKKSTDPLFGPSIGSVSNGPAWTLSSEKKVVTDELTPDIVNLWIEKSKEPSQPTTTLQALVNLKRPTLRLSPLASTTDDTLADHDHDHQLHHHGLEFEYDCDAPKCGIYVHVHLPKTHPDAPPSAGAGTQHSGQLAKLLVFETVVDGGFGCHLKLEEGALLELGRFEHSNSNSNSNLNSGLGGNGKEGEAQSGGMPPPEVLAEASAAGATSTGAAADGNGVRGNNNNNTNNRRRLTHFYFRKRSQNHSISGPALAVMDAADPAAQDNGNANNNSNTNANTNGTGKANGKDEQPEEGVKVTIRLAALDEQGTELASPNEQTTYLHIVRFGQREVNGEGEVEDLRPWVVKVVKREATIGPHTFHLHEIFGLTTSSSSSAHPTALPPPSSPPPAQAHAHTYPPEEKPPQALAPLVLADDEDPQSECLLCLSSPREVVLLPCRHLVACKDCALNMVEFGAGGTITQAVEVGDEVPGAGAGAAGGVGGGGGVGGTGATAVASALATPPPVNNNTRRKRKAKGWFCPVCRQPYTSMLRLTTSAPPLPLSKEATSGRGAAPGAGDAEGEGDVTEDEGGGGPLSLAAGPITSPEQAHVVSSSSSSVPMTSEVRAGGGGGAGAGVVGVGGLLRPGFLRGLSLGRGQQQQQQQQQRSVVPDVENQVGQARA